MSDRLTISNRPEELGQGLFGQIFLYVFEILPALDEQGIIPTWHIRSDKYGSPPDFDVIPGLLETPGATGDTPDREIDFFDFRAKHSVTLGNDWEYVSALWKRFFRWPARVIRRADSFPALDGALGLHYRGTDKNKDPGQTNPVSAEQFLRLVSDFLETRPQINTLFVASDEPAFVELVRTRQPALNVINTGEVTFWDSRIGEGNIAKGDHALLDCLLLSRCKYLLKCQSALSAFAKVLNPRIDAYRVSADKLRRPLGIYDPYFPDAYIPPLTSTNSDCQRILAQLMAGDWTENRAAMKQYGSTFKYKYRKDYMRRDRPFRWWTPLGLHRRLDIGLHQLSSALNG